MIVAIYIEQYEDLIDTPQTINLGGKYLYKFKKENDTIIVSRTINEQYVAGFFDISNSGCKVDLVTAIVGENGVGKTRLLGAFIYKRNALNRVVTIICEDENSNLYYLDSKYDVLKIIHTDGVQKNIDRYNLNNDISNLYYTSYIKNKSFEKELDTFLIKDISFYTNYNTSINDLYYQFLIQQIEFSKTKEFLNIVAPKIFNDKYKDKSYYLALNLNFLLKDSITLYNYTIGNLNKILEKFELGPINNIEHLTVQDFDKTILLSIIKTFAIDENIVIEDNIEETSGYYDIFIKIMTQVNSNKIDMLKDYYNQFYKKLNSWFEKNKNIIRIKIGIFNLPKPYNISVLLNVLIEIQRGLQFYNLYKDFINEIINLYKENDSPRLTTEVDIMTRYGLFYLDSGHSLSGGESALINFYTLLYNRVKYFTVNKNMVFFLDEADLGFHPSWKKKYVKILLETIPHFFPKETKLQIIFTTHDPLTLSDMPNNNVVFLKKDDNGKGKTIVANNKEKPNRTFGANVTDILANSFFIQDGLIGDFAKEKINATIDWINKQKENKNPAIDKAELEKHRRIVNMIDEPVIRRKLQEMLNEVAPQYIDKKAILEQQIEELQRQLKELGE